MFIKIVGYIWLGMGIILLIRPQVLKKRLLKKGLRRLRKLFALLALVLGGLLISIGFKFQGILPKILVILGILGIIKGFLLLNSKSSDALFNWAAELPLTYFRIGACCQIAIGIIILSL
ncbi:MAG: hypothetical protein JSW18_04415 [Candidatus Omnitrophota bacterium]|nr:MAG: hypothetical protein JSW18_04415 [Candidatus Omnitrophota bacterium]